MTSLGKLLRPFFGVSQAQATSFGAGDSQAAQRMETVISTVTRGCQATLQNSRFEALVPRLNAVEPELRGFAYEGAGTGLAALDCFLPWKNRTKAFLDGPGAAYIYAVQIGAGMALARLRRRPEPFLARLDPVLGWIAIDGYGFHEGFFARQRYVRKQAIPTHLSSYGRRAFDQGLGRSIWFLGGGNIGQVAATITAFVVGRQADLWSGVGLACGYTGGVERAAIESLQQAAGLYAPELAVGAAIAANARHRAGSPAPYAELACAALCGRSSERASHIVNAALQDLPPDGQVPAYAVWRQRLATEFAAQTAHEYQKEVAR
jgi:Protein of unknown function (DUF1702)